ncbi:type II secretion system minor pseudopilin GspK [Allohahella sp. A8]|uniref:type II secretion system minor pseudopilin GspK n=1 Tax=Allohahella sp. A8 TaxID=3141461 RepID=UPI003A7FDC59
MIRFRTVTGASQRQRGVALILVLLVVALGTAIVTAMRTTAEISFARTANVLMQQQSVEFALAGETYARLLLKKDLEEDKKTGELVDFDVDNKADPLNEVWGVRAVQIPISLTSGIEGQIDDLQGRFNMNSLLKVTGGRDASGALRTTVNTLALEKLNRLLDSLYDDEGSIQRPPELHREHFVDWLDDNQDSLNFKGAEDYEYLGKVPPYRTGGTWFRDMTELWLIEAMTPEVYRALEPHVAFLPWWVTQVNVNTATVPVLMATLSIPRQNAEEIVAERLKLGGFKDLTKDFLSLPALAGKGSTSQDLTLASSYFQASIRSINEDSIMRLLSTLYRDPNDGSTLVLQRDYGKKFELTKQIAILDQ